MPRAARPILVFVHIFSSAGTTTRETLKQWSRRRESPTATCRFVSAGRCGGGGARRRLTFASFVRLLRPRRRRLGSANALCTSGARVAVPRPDVDVVAGHLWFGTLPASRPAIYVTCLRDPVVLRISAALYLRLKRYDALSLEDVAADVAAGYVKKANKEKPFYANSVKRLGAAEPMSRYGSYVNGAVASESARRARARPGRVLRRRRTDGEVRPLHRDVEEIAALERRDRRLLARRGRRRENGNKCKHSTCAVLNALGADARRALNRTVAYERKVYAAAVAVHDRRCAERLGKKVCDAVPASEAVVYVRNTRELPARAATTSPPPNAIGESPRQPSGLRRRRRRRSTTWRWTSFRSCVGAPTARAATTSAASLPARTAPSMLPRTSGS